MGNRFYGALIRTRNLDSMRQFLTSAVGLGLPVVDSSFWIEYEIVPGGMVLAVERDETALADTRERIGNVAWCLELADLVAFEKRMTEQGFGPQGEREVADGRRGLIFLDPDGNQFVAIGGE